MVPAVFVALAEVPLTPNGKIDRGRLPAPEVSAPADGFVAPRDDIERRLVAIWEDVLGIAPIGVQTDFFDLGVSSITAARLFAEIERREGAALPMGALFQAPTVEALARLVGRHERSPWTSLVPIHPEGTQTPIFCVHGGAGTVLHLQPLSRELGADQPFYALQAQGLYGGAPPHSSVEQMADHYLAEMRTVQPTGPYQLAGYCFGAIVAQEMAVRLRARGEQVAFVAAFNGPSAEYLRRYGNLPTQRRRQGLRFVDPDAAPADRAAEGAVARAPATPAPARAGAPAWTSSTAARAARSLARRGERVVRREVRRGQIIWSQKTGRGLPEHLRDREFLRLAAVAEHRHEPRRFDGLLLAFWGRDLWERTDDAWRGLAAVVEDHEIEGVHLDQRVMMGEPAVGHLARALSDRMAALRTAGAAPAVADPSPA